MPAQTGGDRVTDYRNALHFDSAMRIGDPCRVFWTNCGMDFDGLGRIAKVNDKSVLVELTEPVPSSHGGYPAGQIIKGPRIRAYKLWSWRNCCLPIQPVSE